MQSDIQTNNYAPSDADLLSWEASWGGKAPSADPRVRVFLGRDYYPGDPDWSERTPDTVAWSEDVAKLSADIGELLPPSERLVWLVYAEQGYDEQVLVSWIKRGSEGTTTYATDGRCPKTRFVHCEPLPEKQVKPSSKQKIDVVIPDGFDVRLRSAMQADAMMYTHYEPCCYTYSDEDVASDLAKVEAQNEVRKPTVIWPVCIAALVFGGLTMWALRVASWPGNFAVVGSVVVSWLLPVVLAETVIVLIAKLKEPGLAKDILIKRLPVGGVIGQHEARFSFGPRVTTYEDESTYQRSSTGVASFEETKRFVLVTFEDGTLIPVSKAAL